MIDVLAQAPEAPPTPAGQLVAAALIGIAVIVLLISWLHLHPFLALIGGSAVLGVLGGPGPEGTTESFQSGVGDTVGGVGVLIALGAMIGGLLADSGAPIGSSTPSHRGSAGRGCRGRWRGSPR